MAQPWTANVDYIRDGEEVSARVANRPDRTNPHHLALGYWVVKNPGQDRLSAGISFEEARAEEAGFFRTDRNWAPTLAAWRRGWARRGCATV